MKTQLPEKVYTKIDIEKSYVLGLENAVVILENSIGLNYLSQRKMLEVMKEVIMRKKINAVMDNSHI